jgi:predicted anti-sigma-YlaC factor YlaD
MRLVSARPRRCERARQWISLGADGELSPFEQALLASHLGRCEECSAFRDDVTAIARGLRSAPLERMSRPVDLPLRRRMPLRRLQLGAATSAAAIALVALALGGTLGSKALSGSDHQFAHERPAYLQSVQYEMRLMRRVRPALQSASGRAL